MQTRLIRSQALQIDGADAASFIQAQVMSDAGALADGQWQWSGWLTPKGRLVAFFALYRQAADHWLLWLPAGGAADLAGRMQRFVFRSKVGLQVREDLQAVGRIGPPGGAVALEAGPAPDDAVHARLALEPEREVVIIAGAAVAVDENVLARWYLADLAAGIPLIGAGQPASEQFVPQWLSLERLKAFSVKKGCYPGQEIVSRMHFLGQSKRAAFRLKGPGAPPPAQARVLSGDDRSLGEIVWASADGEGWQALAVLNAEQGGQVACVRHGDADPVPAGPA